MKVTIDSVEETEAFNYRMKRGIDKNLGDALILIRDYQGAKTKSYIFTSKGYKSVVIEDPTGTVIWKGRIKNTSTSSGFLSLGCEGWLAQMNDVNIASYDTKEILKSGTTTREGVIGTVSTVYLNNCTVGGANPSWTTNQWADGTYAVVFPDKLASQSRYQNLLAVSRDYMTPYSGRCYDWSPYTNSQTKNWDHDYGNLCNTTTGGRAIWFDYWSKTDPAWLELTFTFTSGSKSSVSSIDIEAEWGQVTSDSDQGSVYLKLYNYNTSSWDIVVTKNPSSNSSWDETYTGVGSSAHVNTDGTIKLRVWEQYGDAHSHGRGPFFDYVKLKVNFSGSIVTSIFPITANTDNDITSSVNFYDAGVRDNDPFCICRMTTEHVKALVQAYDVQKTLGVTHVHASNNYVARAWKEPRALQIISELAIEDKTNFWVDLSDDFHYNETYSPSGKILDDNDVFSRLMKFVPGELLANEAHVWGHKYSDSNEVNATRVNDTSKTTFGLTRTVVERDTTIYTQIDAQTKGDGILSRTAFPENQFHITLRGKKNYDGDTIDIAELIRLDINLWDIDENFLVVEKSYDPTRGEMEYGLAKTGSSAKYQPLGMFGVLTEMSERVSRIMNQYAER